MDEIKNERRDRKRKRKQIERWKIIKRLERKRKLKNEIEIAIPQIYFALTLHKTIDL